MIFMMESRASAVVHEQRTVRLDTLARRHNIQRGRLDQEAKVDRFPAVNAKMDATVPGD